MTKMIIDFTLNYKIAQVQLYYIVFVFDFLLSYERKCQNL